jgi:hypothetical protein
MLNLPGVEFSNSNKFEFYPVTDQMSQSPLFWLKIAIFLKRIAKGHTKIISQQKVELLKDAPLYA